MDQMSSLKSSYIKDLFYDIYSIIFTYLIAVYYVLKQFVATNMIKSEYKMKRGQVAIVTGGLQGIGLEIVRQLMFQGMHVIIASPISPDAKKIVQSLERLPEGKVEFKEMDLSSLNSIDKFADVFLQQNLPLHILVNNAGIMFGPYSVTENGFEAQLGINYLGHLYLIYKLLPRLSETGNSSQMARIINVSSCCLYAGRINFQDLNSKNYYSSNGSYCQSKLAIAMSSTFLNELLKKRSLHLTVNSVHPGVIHSNLFRNTFFKYIPFINRILLKSPKEGAKNVVYVAVADELEGIGGKYFEYGEIISSKILAQNEQLQKKLWNVSCEMLRINDFFKCNKTS